MRDIDRKKFGSNYWGNFKVLLENSNINVIVNKAYENINKYSLKRQASEFEKIFKL